MNRAFLPALLLLSLPATAVPHDNTDTLPTGKPDRITHRKLTWNDFRVDDYTPGMSAQTHTFTSYSYRARAKGRAGSYEAEALALIFEGGFDRSRSWRRSNVTERSTLLLEHEQGHFDINELKLRQLRAWDVSKLPHGFGSTGPEAFTDLRKKLDKLYNDEIDDLHATQKQYDRETNHGTIRPAQKQWTGRLQKALSQTTKYKS